MPNDELIFDMAEVFKEIITNNININKINFYYTTDLKQNDENLSRSLTEFVLDETTNKYKAHKVELKLLDYLGVSPSLDSCSSCGSTKNIIALSVDDGGYICGECYQDRGLVSEKAIKLIRMYYYVDIKSISKLDVSFKVEEEINSFLDEYYSKYTGLYLKSKDFIIKEKLPWHPKKTKWA